ncbi:MAG: ABC transporter substrate-binding protein [Deltaproteobacteria bacterium]|nr:MAG: ABC transporter substrate-binding protein [Deltaproteobacteria bacterium]
MSLKITRQCPFMPSFVEACSRWCRRHGRLAAFDAVSAHLISRQKRRRTMVLTGRHRASRYGRLWILLALVFTFFSFPMPGAAQLAGRPEKSNLTISYTQASGAFTPLWVAHEAGLFKKHGLDAALKLLNSQVAAQALIAGEVDVISTGPDLVNMRLQGAPAKYIGGTLQRFIFQLWGAKGVNSLAELKGKIVAVTTPRTSTEIATREALKKTGVISDKDVSFIYVQTIPAVLSAVLGGKTSAGTLSAPNTLKARDAGLGLLLDIAQTNVPGLHLAYGTTERTIKSNPNSLIAFLKAVAEATVLSKQNPAVAKKAIGKYTDSDDPKMIDGTYEQFAPYWDASLAVRSEPIQGQLMYLDEKEFPRAKDARPADFIDNSFAENLKSSGFLQALGLK